MGSGDNSYSNSNNTSPLLPFPPQGKLSNLTLSAKTPTDSSKTFEFPMEEESSVRKRRNSVSSSAVIPANLEVISEIKPRKSPSINGHNYHRLPLSSSSSSSPSSSSSIFATADFDLVSLKSSPISYTSLKDLIPSSPSNISPTPASAVANSSPTFPAASTSSGGASSLEICISNRLVKQAAWAYLQPMASSPSASGRRLWSYFTGDFIMPFLSSIKRTLVDWAARSCNWLLDALWLVLCR